MPPVETYFVRFRDGNLHPSVNLHNWPDMVQSPQVPGVIESVADNVGLRLRCVRDDTAPAGTGVANQIVLTPPAWAIPLDCRLFLSATFDLPFARALPGSSKVPEPWAVVLSVIGDGRSVLGESAAYVTCQFHRTYNGVRLNTPGNLQNSSSDQGKPIDSPLDYSRWQPRRYRWFYVASSQFTLEHAFCGWGLAANGHTAGSGSLSMRGWPRRVVSDQRVYSSAALVHGDSATTYIKAVRVGLVTLSGVGEISVRLQSFGVSFKDSAVGAHDPVVPVRSPQ